MVRYEEIDIKILHTDSFRIVMNKDLTKYLLPEKRFVFVSHTRVICILLRLGQTTN